MPVIDLADLSHVAPARTPLFGLDLGEKTIGVAISDLSRLVATPVVTLRRVKFTHDAKALFGLIASRDVHGLVVGLPVNMDGSEGPRCQSVRAFIRHLLRLKDLPAAFWDERLSTAAVNRTLIDEADVSRRRRAQLVDRMAAAWILQGALDRLRESERGPRIEL